MARASAFSANMGAISMATILQVTTPVFISDGQAVSATVAQDNSIMLNRVLFPQELAYVHVGHCWPIDGLTLHDITDSICMAAASHTPLCAPFLTLLIEPAPVFQAWRGVVHANSGAFQVDYHYYQDVEQLFPNLASVARNLRPS
jgi:hypothetical protein